MIVAGLLLKLVVGGSAFGLSRIDAPTLRWTAADAILAGVELPLGTNLFAIRTEPIAERLQALPGVAAVRVSVALPDALVIEVDERAPILAWQVNAVNYLVDRDGALFATADPATLKAASLPVVVDERAASLGGLVVGSSLDPVDLDVATRLGALAPSDVGSVAVSLRVGVADDTGYVLTTAPGSWTAVFGYYSPALRSTDSIPGQVRLLRSLLADREASVARVYLAGDLKGTYVPKPTPR